MYHREIFEWEVGITLSQPVNIIGNTGEESWECMLSTPNLQLQKKIFCQAQTCLHKIRIKILAVGITIDHLHLAFTTKSIWTQGHTLFQQSMLRTARVPHSLPVADRWVTRKCKSPPQFYSKCAYSGLCQMCCFPAVSRKSWVYDQLLWKQKPRPKDKPDSFSRCRRGTNSFLSLCLTFKQCYGIRVLWRW